MRTFLMALLLTVVAEVIFWVLYWPLGWLGSSLAANPGVVGQAMHLPAVFAMSAAGVALMLGAYSLVLAGGVRLSGGLRPWGFWVMCVPWAARLGVAFYLMAGAIVSLMRLPPDLLPHYMDFMVSVAPAVVVAVIFQGVGLVVFERVYGRVMGHE